MVSTRKGISGLLNLFVVGVQGRFNEDDGIEAARAMWVTSSTSSGVRGRPKRDCSR